MTELVKRGSKGSPLNLTEFDGNYDHFTEQIALKLDSDDPSVTNARVPTAHEHSIVEVTGLTEALTGKASTATTDALAAAIDFAVLDNDARLTDARAIADGDYGAVSFTAGAATLEPGATAGAVAGAEIADLQALASAVTSYIIEVIMAPLDAGGYLRINEGKTALESEVPTPDETVPGVAANSGSVTLDFATPRWRSSGLTGNVTFNDPDNLPVNGNGQWIATFGGAHTVSFPSGWLLPGGVDYVGTAGTTVWFTFWREDDSPSVVHVFASVQLEAKA